MADDDLSKDEEKAATRLLEKGWNTKDITACIVIARYVKQPVLTVATMFASVDAGLNKFYLNTQ